MHIDRSRFLALTALLATGCGAGRDIRQVTIVDLPPAPASDAGTDATMPDKVAAANESYPADEAYPPDEGYPPGEGVGLQKAYQPCGQSSRSFSTGKTGCADTNGKPLDCKSPVPGTGAEFAAEKCFSYAQAMLPGVARRAQGCLKKLGRAPDSCAVYRCGSDALMDACVTAKATAACKRLQLPANECASYLSGLNDKGLRSVEGCAKKAGAPLTIEELYSCVESL